MKGKRTTAQSGFGDQTHAMGNAAKANLKNWLRRAIATAKKS
ncbi:hypothetical protein [Spirulina subsalsa]|nr:hypothetical protein [Spirulina subsalsa]